MQFSGVKKTARVHGNSGRTKKVYFLQRIYLQCAIASCMERSDALGTLAARHLQPLPLMLAGGGCWSWQGKQASQARPYCSQPGSN